MTMTRLAKALFRSVWLALVLALAAANVVFALGRAHDSRSVQQGQFPEFSLRLIEWIKERAARTGQADETVAAPAASNEPEAEAVGPGLGPAPEAGDAAADRRRELAILLALPMLGSALPVLTFLGGLVDAVRATRGRRAPLLLGSLALVALAVACLLANTVSTFLIFEAKASF